MSEKTVFPITNPSGHYGRGDELVVEGGLTKRELFAIMIVQGMFASGDIESFSNYQADKVACEAIEYSDALLKELSKER
jgi:hypothetical protein